MAGSEASGGGSARTGRCRWDTSRSGRKKIVENIKEVKAWGRALRIEGLRGKTLRASYFWGQELGPGEELVLGNEGLRR